MSDHEHVPPPAAGEPAAAEAKNAREAGRRRAYRSASARPGRRPAAARESAFHALLWVLDGATGLVEELRHNDLGLPEAFWMHAYAARREGLLALRSLLDELIDEAATPSPTEAPPEQPPQRRSGIQIDF
ncbi:MAG: hypothetical protein ACOYL7_06680 [Caldilinea sp.]